MGGDISVHMINRYKKSPSQREAFQGMNLLLNQ